MSRPDVLKFAGARSSFEYMEHYLKKISLVKRQREIIVGTLLGDGHLETQTNGKTYRLKILHAASQKEYLDWLYLELQTISAHPPRHKIIKACGKEYSNYWFDTVSSPSFRFYAQQFYEAKRKQVPKFINKLLTPLGLAVWYMDDGSIKSHETRGRILNTQGFSKPDVLRLIECLSKRFGILTAPRKQPEGWQIFIPAEMYEKLVQTIGHYVIPSMRYKLFFPSHHKKTLD